MQSDDKGTGRATVDTAQMAQALSVAKAQIAALESRCESKQEALRRLLAEDLKRCEELALLQKVIWGYHRALPGGCDCSVCVEVERSHQELEGLM